MIRKAKDPNQAVKELARAKKALRRELSFDEAGEKPERKLSPLALKKQAARKKQFRMIIYLILFGLFCYLVYWLVKPYKSDMKYGICKVFIELQVPYPYTLYFSEVIDFNDSVRVWFSHYDSFGDYRLMPVQCYFGAHETYGMGLKRITIGRREIDPEVVARFNHSLPAVFAYPPDLVYPTPLPNDPAQLQFDFDRFRKKIL